MQTECSNCHSKNTAVSGSDGYCFDCKTSFRIQPAGGQVLGEDFIDKVAAKTSERVLAQLKAEDEARAAARKKKKESRRDDDDDE